MQQTFGGDSCIQRAAKRGLDLSWLDLAFLGRHGFQSRGPEILTLKVFGTSALKIGAPPQTLNSTTTDPTPHSRPSDACTGYSAQVGCICRRSQPKTPMCGRHSGAGIFHECLYCAPTVCLQISLHCCTKPGDCYRQLDH